MAPPIQDVAVRFAPKIYPQTRALSPPIAYAPTATVTELVRPAKSRRWLVIALVVIALAGAGIAVAVLY
jgi:hypothetical protein